MKNKLKHFAASGSCFHEDEIIKGTVKDGVFYSNEITGSLTKEFWDKLRELAENKKKFIYLYY